MTSSVMVWGALFFSKGKILKTKELCVLLSAAIIVRLTNESINGDANIAKLLNKMNVWRRKSLHFQTFPQPSNADEEEKEETTF